MQRALVQEVHGKPLVVRNVPIPEATSGSAVVQVIYAPIISYMRDVYNGRRKYNYATPLIPGTSAIGRVAAVGPDAVLLNPNDLVYVDCYIRGRDDHDAGFLLGLSEGGTEASRKLMQCEWRNGTFAEYVKAPLENVFKLDETRLCGDPSQGGLGYKMEQLCWWMMALVPCGGLRSIDLQAGEIVIISPATGGFGSAAVLVALAMGAGKVIAMGRNAEALANLKKKDRRIETVQMRGDLKTEMDALSALGKADAFLDISPAAAEDSTHFRAAIQSLRHSGRVSLMGGIKDNLPIPHRFIMRNDITLKGKWMYTRDDNVAFMRLLCSGVLTVREIVKVHRIFEIDDWEEAFELAWDNGRLGDLILFSPGQVSSADVHD